MDASELVHAVCPHCDAKGDVRHHRGLCRRMRRRSRGGLTAKRRKGYKSLNRKFK